jgi:hypothetical protein
MSEGDAGPDRREQARLVGGVTSCVVGVLLGAGQILFALFGAGANVTPGALGIAFCILAYFLDFRKLATVAIFLCVAAIIFGLAASQGLIPGIAPSDHAFPYGPLRF